MERTPRQKAVWQVGAKSCVLILAHHREWEIADIGIEFVDIPARTAADVGEKQILFLFAPSHTSCELQLAVARFATATNNHRVLPLHNLWFNHHHAFRIAVQIIGAQLEAASENVLN